MIGFPKVLNTKQDYLNCLTDYPEQTKEQLQALLDERFAWEDKGEIEVGDMPIEDDTHKIVEDKETGKKNQYELVESPNAKIFRIGFTVAEVEELLGK
jgi:hypothetical protein